MSEDLARRAVACKGWRWMPGMLTLPFHEDDDRRLPTCHPAWRVSRPGIAGPFAHDPTWGALPDLADPATVGCLLALVREAWSGTFVMPYDKKPGWWVAIMPAGPWPDPGPTEAAALVAALEAAEGQEVSDD